MLELRQNCEYCEKNHLKNVCPNCGGGFASRPIRPLTAHRKGLSLKHQSASKKRIHSSYSLNEISAFADTLKDIKPDKR